jgi:hypothetical protein
MMLKLSRALSLMVTKVALESAARAKAVDAVALEQSIHDALGELNRTRPRLVAFAETRAGAGTRYPRNPPAHDVARPAADHH